MSEQSIAERILSMVEFYKQLSEEARQLSAKAEEKTDAANRITREDIPELMREGQLTELKLEDGTKVKLFERVQASISEDRKAAAHKWLEENGFGGLIKNEVTVAFGAGEHDAAVTFANVASDLAQGHDIAVKEAVHASTLKSFIAEQLEAGNPIPAELFGIFTYTEAKVTLPKR